MVIPEYVIVHDGAPSDSSARNYWVRYRDYIKNVASSEIYATWTDAAIRANVLAIMSFVLNRVYTEWYSQGNAAASAESTVTSESGAKASTVESSAAEASAETTTEVSADAANGTSYEDNFAVPTEDATAFAKKIQDAVAAEDLDALADLVNYPVYVALGDGSVIETREDLIALGADKIFTPELKDSMANADLSELSPSMAGFTLYSTGDGPNITFNVQNGVLGISGINY